MCSQHWYLRGKQCLKKLFRFPLDVMQNSMVSNQILAKIYSARFKESAYNKIQQYFDQFLCTFSMQSYLTDHLPFSCKDCSTRNGLWCKLNRVNIFKVLSSQKYGNANNMCFTIIYYSKKV